MANELSILELRGLLKLRAEECYGWVARFVPDEAIRHQGRCLYVATWGLNAALARCVWRPHLHQPRGYQGHPGRIPPNVHCRDDLGRFTSDRSSPRPPRRKGFVHPTRRRYIKQTD